MQQTLPHTKLDYRNLLRLELSERQRRNPAFSLRAFASFLGLSAPFLSQVLTGQRVLSEEKAMEVVKRLRWPLRRQKLFLHLVRYQRTPTAAHRELVLQQADLLSEMDFLEIEREQFELISGWQHFALSELTLLPDFSPDPGWIAKRLGISQRQASESIRRLKKVGLLQNKGGRLVKSQSNYRIQDTPLAAIRNFHRSHLVKAAVALEHQPLETRDLSGSTIAFDAARLPEVRALIREFQEKLDTYCANGGPANSVYHLAIQFYRLDQELL